MYMTDPVAGHLYVRTSALHSASRFTHRKMRCRATQNHEHEHYHRTAALHTRHTLQTCLPMSDHANFMRSLTYSPYKIGRSAKRKHDLRKVKKMDSLCKWKACVN